jgi:hypothetical protein
VKDSRPVPRPVIIDMIKEPVNDILVGFIESSEFSKTLNGSLMNCDRCPFALHTDHNVYAKSYYPVEHILCVQLSEERQIILEHSDFEHTFSVLGDFRPRFTAPPINEQVKQWAEKTTEIVNRRLQYFLKGKRGKEALEQAFKIFEYIWFRGAQNESIEIFKCVALSDLSKDLVKYRRLGRPTKTGSPRYNYEIINNNPISHATTLLRILHGLVDAQLIEEKKIVVDNEKNPGKELKNTFYRISPLIFDEAITSEEQLERLEKFISKRVVGDQQVGKEILAREWILTCNGLSIPQETVNNWIKMWDAGDREIVYGYGSHPTPFKIMYNPTGNILEKG